MVQTATLWGAILLALSATGAEAHAFAQRYDLPLPLSYWLAGAGAAVALSFLGAIVAMPAGVASRASIRPREGDGRGVPPLVRAAGRVLAVCLFCLVLAAGFTGPQDEPQDNLLPVTVWVLWWVGLTVFVALFGDVWRAVNPIRVIAEWMRGALAASGLGVKLPVLALPEWVGIWPAVLIFLAFAWAELVWTSNGVPAMLARAVVLYCLLSWVAMALFGIEVWLRRGEAFALYFALIGRFAAMPVMLWSPWRGSGFWRVDHPSQAIFILIVLATVTFDGLKETPFWAELSGGAMDALYRTGAVAAIGNVMAETLIRTGGLLIVPLLMLAAYLSACAITCRLARLSPGQERAIATGDIALRFAGSLVPIAIGYHVAHYFSYLLIQGQWVVPALSDPFGLGWNLIGTRGFEPDIGLIDAAVVWWVAVAAIVVGHVAAVLIGHRTALEMFRDAQGVVKLQLPMLMLMVGYTMLSLWILAQPIVAH